jgi:hypothetical protein
MIGALLLDADTFARSRHSKDAARHRMIVQACSVFLRRLLPKVFFPALDGSARERLHL